MVIAHRGASGYLPENTLPAFALAHAMGAHAIELDVVMTRDGVPVAFHDLTLEAVTDVRERFPDRARRDGRWYVIDLSFDELRQLELAHPGFPAGPPEAPILRIPTLAEVIALILTLNARTARQVGLFVELKAPAFHHAEGSAMEDALLELVAANGNGTRLPPTHLVCEEAESLRRLRLELGASVSFVQIIDEAGAFDAMATRRGLDEIATYADGIGPEKGRIEDAAGRPVAENQLVREAHARSLTVHPFTFRVNGSNPHWANFEAELKRFFFTYGVDGVFTDFPDRTVLLLAEA